MLAPDSAVLQCQADGEPVPNITWIRELNNGSNTELISEGNTMITEHVSGLNKTSVLTIQPTSIQDSGSYRCRAQNELNSLLSGIFCITIYGKFLILLIKLIFPGMFLAGPRVTFPEDNDVFVVNVTGDIIVSCIAFALPPPTIEFCYNGSLLVHNDENTFNVSTPMLAGNEASRNLTLFNASMWTEALASLQCRATNTIIELNLTLDVTKSYQILVQGIFLTFCQLCM